MHVNPPRDETDVKAPPNDAAEAGLPLRVVGRWSTPTAQVKARPRTRLGRTLRRA